MIEFYFSDYLLSIIYKKQIQNYYKYKIH